MDITSSGQQSDSQQHRNESESSQSNVPVVFREIHKNTWLRLTPTGCEPAALVGNGHLKKSENVWVVFCVHNDRDAFLEMYSDQKVAAAHCPERCMALASCLHVTPTIGTTQDGLYEFVVTLRSGIVKLAAATWEVMMEWVGTLRSKLQELKVLTPPENLYSQQPHQPRPHLLPTRDPTSPLPPTPPGHHSLVPGTEALEPAPSSLNVVANPLPEVVSSPPVSPRATSTSTSLYINPISQSSSSPVTLARNASESGSNVTVIEVAGPAPSPAPDVFDFTQMSETVNTTTASHYEHLFPGNETTGPPPLPTPRPTTDLSRSSEPAASVSMDQTPAAASSLSIVDTPPRPSVIATSSRTPHVQQLLPRRRPAPHVMEMRGPPILRHRLPPPPMLRPPPLALAPVLPPPPLGIIRPTAVLTLREQQVLQLSREMRHPGGVRLQIRRNDCVGAIALIDAFGAVWVAGWKQREHPKLYNALHIGDRLMRVAGVPVPNASEAQRLIKEAACLYVELVVHRVPSGQVLTIKRPNGAFPGDLGIDLEGGTSEIRCVRPLSPAALAGLTPKAPTCDGLSLTNWVLTEVNSRPLNLFSKEGEARDRLNALGVDVSIMVQPFDLIKQIKKQLKALRGYKDYLVQ